MKVTKLIREYVTESVEKAIPTENLCTEYEVANSNAKKICETLQNEIADLYKKRVEELKVDYPIPEDFKISYNDWVTCSDWGSEVRRKRDQLVREAIESRKRKINDILLSLELGANREELNRMIESLVNEVPKEGE